jgi:flagellar biosynthesis protein FlhA
MSGYSRWKDLVLPVALIASILVILVPLPAALLDLLLAANITLAVVVLLTTVTVRSPLEFSLFPTFLLAATLGRLVLNVASTRLILTRAATDQMEAAGGVIRGFGEFVAGDHAVVGLIIFCILIVIQFLVITKGATRISEVAARFALDGMPGRQMAIDADVNAGLIDQKEARRRREEITHQADFYGAMDGASKFVRGDAIAGMVITMINIIGGLYIGVFEAGMPLSQAASLFTKLTIGDGLVSQIPAFLVALGAGLLVTRSTQRVELSQEFLGQLFAHPRTLLIAAGFLGVLLFTQLPALPLLGLGFGCVSLAAVLTRQQKHQEAQQQAVAQRQQTPAKTRPDERIEDYLAIDPMEVEIGVGLIRLADPHRGGDLLARVTGVRQAIAREIGIVLPKVRIRDNMQLGDQQYRIKLANNPVAEAELRPDRLLATEWEGTGSGVPGEEVIEPVFQRPAKWLPRDQREQAERLGCRLQEPQAVLAEHLQEVVRQHADEILDRDSTKHLIDELRKTSPAVVDELIPEVMKLSDVQQVLQMLLREQIPIRQLGRILETLGDHVTRTRHPIWLHEAVRQRLARTICSRYRDKQNRLMVVTLDPALEDRLKEGMDYQESGVVIRLTPSIVEQICDRISRETTALPRLGRPNILLVNPSIRPGLRHLLAVTLPKVHVLSYQEVTRDTRIESIATVRDLLSSVEAGTPVSGELVGGRR